MKLSPVPSKKLIKILTSLGFEKVRQKGSHMSFKNREGRLVIVPEKREIVVGTLMSILRQADISVEDYQKYLHKNRKH